MVTDGSTDPGSSRVRDLAFYNAIGEPSGSRRLVLPLRRILRRLLRPLFLRQVEILEELCRRLDDAEAGRTEQDRRQDALLSRIQATSAMGWDQVAMARRLAVLEDRVEALLASAKRPDTLDGPDRTAAA